jgi:carbamoyltransferase
MKVVGISPTHDSGVCLVEDGKITKFFKEERLTRKKRDDLPFKSLESVLQGTEEIDIFAYAPPQEGSGGNELSNWLSFAKKFSNINSTLDLCSDHHKTHAALAFYNSGFSEAAIIVADGQGSIISGGYELESIFHASYPDLIIPVYKNILSMYGFGRPIKIEGYPDCEVVSRSHVGLVSMYCTATILIGEHPLDNGKTMGLAAYGHNDKFPELLMENGTIVNRKLFTSWDQAFPQYKINSGKEVGLLTENNYEYYANYAMHVQKQSEDVMLKLIQKAIDSTGSRNVCITGGYGLNVVANARYLKEFPGINFYFEPFADDGGNAIGAAMLAYRQESQDKTVNKLKHTFYHGRGYDLPQEDYLDLDAESISAFLDRQMSVGMFYGLAEAGPRALGHRSILFDARNPDAKEITNSIKKREWYRPFAAACLEEDAYKYFSISPHDGYEFMTINADANGLAKQEIPGVIHVDGTCRIQIVRDPDEPLFKVLESFKKRTGVGVLLNTSFNLAGEAMVETPEDAISSYFRSELYCIWFPEFNKALIK